jgi:hypothetical protein
LPDADSKGDIVDDDADDADDDDEDGNDDDLTIQSASISS